MRRYVSSVREIVGAEGPLVMSNEIFMPGLRQAGPCPGAPLRDSTLTDLPGRRVRRQRAAPPRRLVALTCRGKSP